MSLALTSFWFHGESLIKSGVQIAAQAVSDAKRKAQRILYVFSSIFTTQMALIAWQDVRQGAAAIYSEVPKGGFNLMLFVFFIYFPYFSWSGRGA